MGKGGKLGRVGSWLAFSLLAARPVAAGDAFFKGGFMFHPAGTDLSDRWLLSFGSDYPLNYDETFFLGFELETAYYREPVGGATVQVVPGHGFLNAKFKGGTRDVRPYAGAGFGAFTFFVFLPDDNRWDRDFAFHLLGGVELGRVAVELSATRSFESGEEFRWVLLFGFVW